MAWQISLHHRYNLGQAHLAQITLQILIIIYRLTSWTHRHQQQWCSTVCSSCCLLLCLSVLFSRWTTVTDTRIFSVQHFRVRRHFTPKCSLVAFVWDGCGVSQCASSSPVEPPCLTDEVVGWWAVPFFLHTFLFPIFDRGLFFHQSTEPCSRTPPLRNTAVYEWIRNHKSRHHFLLFSSLSRGQMSSKWSGPAGWPFHRLATHTPPVSHLNEDKQHLSHLDENWKQPVIHNHRPLSSALKSNYQFKLKHQSLIYILIYSNYILFWYQYLFLSHLKNNSWGYLLGFHASLFPCSLGKHIQQE